MYDVDGNGWIDLGEMTRIVVSIYRMMDAKDKDKTSIGSPEDKAVAIFQRMDVNKDGKVTRAEFVRTCLNDQKLLQLLTPNTE